jgi:hypothetical protein
MYRVTISTDCCSSLKFVAGFGTVLTGAAPNRRFATPS